MHTLQLQMAPRVLSRALAASDSDLFPHPISRTLSSTSLSSTFACFCRLSSDLSWTQGRTETIRSVSMASKGFVSLMEDPASTAAQKIQAVRRACEHHQVGRVEEGGKAENGREGERAKARKGGRENVDRQAGRQDMW